MTRPNDPTADHFHDCLDCGRTVAECECYDDDWFEDGLCPDCNCFNCRCGDTVPTGDDLLDKHHAAAVARERGVR